MQLLSQLALVGAFVMTTMVRAEAADDNLPFTILSDGATTCGEFIAEPGGQSLRASWALGYVTGRNVAAPAPERMAGSSYQKPATVIGWLRAYCGAHALQKLVTAAEFLRADFLKSER
jgi:hypothetical protein